MADRAINPATMVELPKINRPEMNVLSASDCETFLRVAKEDRWYALFAPAMSTGMRPEEYLGLHWKDVNLVVGTVNIQRALVCNRKGGGWCLEEPKTSKSRRTIPLSSSVVGNLAAHRKYQLEERFKLGKAYQNLDFVFATEIGTPRLTSNLTRRHFKPILKRAALPSSVRL